MASFKVRVIVYESEEPIYQEGKGAFLDRLAQLIGNNKIKVTDKTFNVNLAILNGKIRELDSYIPNYLRRFRDAETYPHYFIRVIKME